MKKEKCCGCIVINDKKQFLLIKQKEANYWGFPKGHMEEKEHEKQTAIRETKEETNIDVQILSDKKFVISYYIEAKDVQKEVVFFIAKALNQEITVQESEVSDYGWFSKEEVFLKITYEDIKELFTKAIDYLEKRKINEI